MSCDTGSSVIRFIKAHLMWNDVGYSATDLGGCNVPQPSSVLSCNVLERKR